MDSKCKQFVIAVCLFLTCFCFGDIWLTTDLELPCPEPDPDQEITIFINSDQPVFFLDLTIVLAGYVDVIDVVDSSNCSQYGWTDDFCEMTVTYNEEDDRDEKIKFTTVEWGLNNNTCIGAFTVKHKYHGVSIYLEKEESQAFNFINGYAEIDDNSIMFGTDHYQTITKPWYGDHPFEFKYFPPDPDYIPPSDPCFLSDLTALSSYFQYLLLMIDEPNIIEIDSDITTNQIWSAENIYYIVEDISVDENSMLVIEPGTIVMFARSCGIDVYGALISNGTPDRPIFYTADMLYFKHGQEKIGFWWWYYGQYYYYDGITIHETASTACQFQFNFVEAARNGLKTENIQLETFIQNNFFVNNDTGLVETGPLLTNVCNNFFCMNLYSGADIWLGTPYDPNTVVDASEILTIEQNTFDYELYYGIQIHGPSNPEQVKYVEMVNNIVSNAVVQGIYIDGYMMLSVKNTGYYNNVKNHNEGIVNYKAVYQDTEPFYVTIDGPFNYNYLLEDCNFIDAGCDDTLLGYTGLTTDVNSLPDIGPVDLGFHWIDWNYTRPPNTKDKKELNTLGKYWLCWSPYDPNSPGYIDPNDITDPNLIIYGGDLNNDSYVDISDFSALSASWNDRINLYPVIKDGWDSSEKDITVGGDKDKYFYASLYIDGQYVCGFPFGIEWPQSVDISQAGHRTQEFKFIITKAHGEDLQIDSFSYEWSDPVEIIYNEPLIYITVPKEGEPNVPLHYYAINTGSDPVTVTFSNAYDQILSTQQFTGSNISGSIPSCYMKQDFTADDIAWLTFSTGTTKVKKNIRVKKVEYDSKYDNKDCLIILPDRKLSRANYLRILQLNQIFIHKNLRHVTLSDKDATWKEIAGYAQHSKIKYVYILAHGKYQFKYKDTVFNRTLNLLWKKGKPIEAVSCKKEDFINYPKWCVWTPFDNIYVSWASMGFDDISIFYTDQCFGGRLCIDDDLRRLVEAGEGGYLFENILRNDMYYGVGFNESSIANEIYHSWWQEGLFWKSNISINSSYQEWFQVLWGKLEDGEWFDDAFATTVSTTLRNDPNDAVNNFMLYGKGTTDLIKLVGRQ